MAPNTLLLTCSCSYHVEEELFQNILFRAADEANRGIELPNQVDYQRMLAEGQSFVVIAGDEATRIKYGNQLMELGALAIHQHPPVLEAIHHTSVQ